jgi:hypothetical protein
VELERRDATIERLQERVATLTDKLAAARRAARRQAAPHSRDDPADDPASPGRKPGEDYGQPAWRPAPEEVDEVVDVPLLDGCPGCGGTLELERVAHQFVTELPCTLHRIRFDVHVGICMCCGVRVQPRHRRQVSDALGAAGSQLGARAVGLAVLLNKQCGVSPGNIAELYGHLGVGHRLRDRPRGRPGGPQSRTDLPGAVRGDPGLSGGVTG